MSVAPPAAMPPARQRILSTATGLFYARGLRAVGVDTIIAESGVAKATFYKHFPAKDDLIVAHLDVVDEVWSGQLHDAARAAGPNPADQLVGLFDALDAACRRDGYRGLRLHQRGRRVPGGYPRARPDGRAQTRGAGLDDGLARDAGVDDPGRLARSLSLLLDGALASGALDADPEAAAVARTTAAQLVAAAVPR